MVAALCWVSLQIFIPSWLLMANNLNKWSVRYLRPRPTKYRNWLSTAKTCNNNCHRCCNSPRLQVRWCWPARSPRSLSKMRSKQREWRHPCSPPALHHCLSSISKARSKQMVTKRSWLARNKCLESRARSCGSSPSKWKKKTRRQTGLRQSSKCMLLWAKAATTPWRSAKIFRRLKSA